MHNYANETDFFQKIIFSKLSFFSRSQRWFPFANPSGGCKVMMPLWTRGTGDQVALWSCIDFCFSCIGEYFYIFFIVMLKFVPVYFRIIMLLAKISHYVVYCGFSFLSPAWISDVLVLWLGRVIDLPLPFEHLSLVPFPLYSPSFRSSFCHRSVLRIEVCCSVLCRMFF